MVPAVVTMVLEMSRATGSNAPRVLPRRVDPAISSDVPGKGATIRAPEDGVKNSIGLSLVLAAITGMAMMGCAKGSNLEGAGGYGGAGGASGDGAGGQSASSGSGHGGASASGQTASSGSGVSSSSSGKASSSAASGASSTAASSSASGLVCNPPQHVCNGQCAGNTPDTGCTTSVSCSPCPSPVNGMAACAINGTCDVTCNAPYVKSGGSCVCGAACCADADCNGGTCVNGQCQAACNQAACAAICIIQCMKPGLGVCQNNKCVCICPP